MGSRKRSARAREIAEFKAGLGGMDDVFARERERDEEASAQREEARRQKACTSKNRYATRDEAMENLAWCEARGRRGLAVYRCPYCHGWHLTSHPHESND